MQCLQFNLEDYRYVLPVSDVIEIVPYVKLKKAKGQLDYLVGNCDYRGANVPVIDICKLFLGRRSRKKLSTRIIMIEANNKVPNKVIVGLMVEKATEIINIEAGSFVDAGSYGEGMPYLGPVTADKLGYISWLDKDEIFSKVNAKDLFPSE